MCILAHRMLLWLDITYMTALHTYVCFHIRIVSQCCNYCIILFSNRKFDTLVHLEVWIGIVDKSTAYSWLQHHRIEKLCWVKCWYRSLVSLMVRSGNSQSNAHLAFSKFWFTTFHTDDYRDILSVPSEITLCPVLLLSPSHPSPSWVTSVFVKMINSPLNCFQYCIIIWEQIIAPAYSIVHFRMNLRYM